MPAYVAKRLLSVFPVLFGLSVIVFLVMSMIPRRSRDRHTRRLCNPGECRAHQS
jgi:ABC-type dipeptide/oligopeptide/nickel transport system permease component